jgi:RNA polymerase primary sigma factor
MPVQMLHELLGPAAATRVTAGALGAALRASEAVREDTPGMFVASGLRARATAWEASDFSSGAELERLLMRSRPLPRDAQNRRLKTFTALSCLLEFDDHDTARHRLEGRVETLIGNVLAAEQWTLGELLEQASGGGMARPLADGEEAQLKLRTECLSAVRALELLQSSGIGDVREHHSTAQRELILANLRLVGDQARRRAIGGHLQFVDLFQEGVFGLRKALFRYNPFRGFAFSTVAYQWIEQAMSRSIANHRENIRVPVHAQRRTGGALALHTYVGIAEAVGLTSGHDPAQEVHDREVRTVVESILSQALSEREATVVDMRFGIRSAAPMTLEQVGDHLGVTRERIRQIEAEALRKLRSRRWRASLEDCLQEGLPAGGELTGGRASVAE